MYDVPFLMPRKGCKPDLRRMTATGVCGNPLVIPKALKAKIFGSPALGANFLTPP